MILHDSLVPYVTHVPGLTPHPWFRWPSWLDPLSMSSEAIFAALERDVAYLLETEYPEESARGVMDYSLLVGAQSTEGDRHSYIASVVPLYCYSV